MGVEFLQNGVVFARLIYPEKAMAEVKGMGTCEVHARSDGFLLVPVVDNNKIRNTSFSVESEHGKRLLTLESGIVLRAFSDPPKRS